MERLSIPTVSFRSEAQGVVLAELAIVLPILVLLLVGVYDLSQILREQFLLSESVRTALRTIVLSGPYEENRYLGTPAARQEAYVTDRYTRAIEVAKYVLRRNGLNDSNYFYNVLDGERTDAASGTTYPIVQFNISRQPTADLFLLAPGRWYPTCVGGSSLVSGIVVGPGFDVSDPSLNTACMP